MEGELAGFGPREKNRLLQVRSQVDQGMHLGQALGTDPPALGQPPKGSSTLGNHGLIKEVRHGYPRQLREPDIPVQSKLMAVADVYDALTAADRPYKAAVSIERSLEILHQEAEVNLLDAEVLRIFLEARIFERTLVT